MVFNSLNGLIYAKVFSTCEYESGGPILELAIQEETMKTESLGETCFSELFRDGIIENV